MARRNRFPIGYGRFEGIKVHGEAGNSWLSIILGIEGVLARLECIASAPFQTKDKIIDHSAYRPALTKIGPDLPLSVRSPIPEQQQASRGMIDPARKPDR